MSESISGFLSRWKGRGASPDIVSDYLSICRDLPFAEEDLLRKVVLLLRSNMENWAAEHSGVYLRSRPFYCKEDMEDKNDWYVSAAIKDSVETHTSGSSTGFHFMYRRMKSTFESIEWDNHYDLVLDEFGIRKSPDILYFFPNHFKKSGDAAFFCEDSPQPYLNSHGRSRAARVHYANFDVYKRDASGFFSEMFAYVSKNPMDVVFSAGPQINSMCHHMRKSGFSGAVGTLLSQTNERLLQDDASFLFLDNSYFKSVCDHMRCWDGGASFFTCRHGNYHLMDNLSWCEEIGGRLVSTDYFNFASPFVRYWNGDMCRIGSVFLRCDCGRLYREFEFLENRPFSLGGVCLGDLRRKMIDLGMDCIKQVKCYTDRVDVVSSKALSEEEKAKLASLEPRFNFVFSIEEE